VGYDLNNWLVSSSLNITEHWNTSLKNVKVGDVLQRTITRSAAGTLSEFIPEIHWDSVPGVSIYKTRPITHTNKSKTAVSARRSDTANYLFEKEGEVVLPKIEFIYWNFYNKKFYKKTIDSLVIQVAPNADLEMLASIKKQLEADTVEPEEAEDKPFLIFGMTPKRFLLLVILGFVSVYILFKLMKWAFKFTKTSYKNYIQSEKYLFSKVVSALKHKNAHDFLERLTMWMLLLDLPDHSFDWFVKIYGTESLKKEYGELLTHFFQAEEKSLNNASQLIIALKASRKKYFVQQTKNKAVSSDVTWLNPIE
jgi:hypothetical protein